MQGDHLAGNSGNVTEFDSCQGNVCEFGKVMEWSGKILSGFGLPHPTQYRSFWRWSSQPIT